MREYIDPRLSRRNQQEQPPNGEPRPESGENPDKNEAHVNVPPSNEQNQGQSESHSQERAIRDGAEHSHGVNAHQTDDVSANNHLGTGQNGTLTHTNTYNFEPRTQSDQFHHDTNVPPPQDDPTPARLPLKPEFIPESRNGMEDLAGRESAPLTVLLCCCC